MTIHLPSGTVTFLFTDIEGSTQLWEKHPEVMQVALAKHDTILRETIESHNGHIIKTTGDGVHAVFRTVIEGVNAAITAQREFQSAESLKHSAFVLRVRMGIH
nr:adenylate/guanylate cyclase domain-containing protein [Chloroflexota bacterium]